MDKTVIKCHACGKVKPCYQYGDYFYCDDCYQSMEDERAVDRELDRRHDESQK